MKILYSISETDSRSIARPAKNEIAIDIKYPVPYKILGIKINNRFKNRFVRKNSNTK